MSVELGTGSVFMTVCYIDLGSWVVEVGPVSEEMQGGLEMIFDSRFREFPPSSDHTRLVCCIHACPKDYHDVSTAVQFEESHVEASKGIAIRYALLGPCTWMSVAETAIVRFDDSTPARCDVYLHPQPVTDDPTQLIPSPEAFFYPMLVEWLRSFGACIVHCGVTAIRNRAVFLSGPPGSGKSTHVLRMLLRGATFLADDLAILRSFPAGLRLLPFREVANVNADSTTVFPELDFVRNMPQRGDGKFAINVPRHFGTETSHDVGPGIILRLVPDRSSWIKPVPKCECLDGMHTMAWYTSRPERSRQHFALLADWLMESEQCYVSQGYMALHLDDLLARLDEGWK